MTDRQTDRQTKSQRCTLGKGLASLAPITVCWLVCTNCLINFPLLSDVGTWGVVSHVTMTSQCGPYIVCLSEALCCDLYYSLRSFINQVVKVNATSTLYNDA